MHPGKTGDQPYNDASPNGECSLVRPVWYQLPKYYVIRPHPDRKKDFLSDLAAENWHHLLLLCMVRICDL